ncbi:MAG: hypothetical protein L0154_20110 [Chloroflexi bacterium]|nr:hypothetical protein [Chloroflexota bacterium]
MSERETTELQESGAELQSAKGAYEKALEALIDEFPDIRKTDMMQTVEFKEERSLWDLFRDSLLFLLSGLLVFWVILRGIWFVLVETVEDIRVVFRKRKRESIETLAKSREARHLQTLLLEVLWARDYVQQMLEETEAVPYAVRRETLQYIVEHDDVLDEIRRRVIDRADLDPVKLRKAQPTTPPETAWWWFMDNRRTLRARQLNAFWFAAAIVPGLAGIILVTLLTQRLAVNGLDVLSSASVFAELVLAFGGVLAGRELLNAFFVDRSSGRSWQGEISFLLASLFFILMAGFYSLVPPAAAEVYNWFGQRAIEAGNASEAELYLESATRLDPDPHATNYVQVGCLYLTLGSPENAQRVFEEALEAESRLLISRYHLAEIYIANGQANTALQLIEDGLNLLNTEEESEEDFLPLVDDQATIDQARYLLHLALGQAYLETGAQQQAKANLQLARQEFENLAPISVQRVIQPPCTPDESLDEFVQNTKINLDYFRAQTFDAICDIRQPSRERRQAWLDVRNSSQPKTSRQEGYQADAEEFLENYEDCTARD